jgi:hypothetical protein
MTECTFDGCDRKASSKSLCDMHYRRLIKRGSANDRGQKHKDSGNEVERFHKKYTVADSGCWIWTAGTRPNAKGTLYPRHHCDDGKSIGAHRFSYALTNGVIQGGAYVCHKCDTPLCVNPDHLFLGTHADNMRDMVDKGRSFTGKGEKKKGLAKLTNIQADQIRSMTSPQSAIARLFGVSQTTISRIIRGESY